VWYGGTGGLPMYSWDPNTDTFNADAGNSNLRAWVAAGSFTTAATQYPSDFAFKEGQKVTYTNTKDYTAARDIRFDKWVNGDKYHVGAKISRWATHAPASSDTYWKSFKCTQSHTADSAKAPATGANWADYWDVVSLDNPLDDSGDVSGDWYFMPQPAKSIIGTFHGYRLFLRRHDSDNWSWVQYSSPFKPEKGVDIADLVFDPTDWSAATDENGDGGGWIPFREGDGDAIRALQTYGSYLLIFKRWKSFVIAGINEATWNVRNLDPEYGTIHSRSVCVHGGLVYFLTPEGGLMVTDGTRVEPAPGADKVRSYINGRLDLMMASDDTVNWLPTLTTFQDFIYITLSNPNAADDVTLVYHPTTKSFWRTNIPALDVATGRIEGREKMWFVPTVLPASAVKPRVFQMSESTYTDVSKTGTATADISWSIRFPWFNFGTARSERRLRRLWALAKGTAGNGVLVETFKNYNGTTAMTSAARTFTGGNPKSEFVEGLVGTNTVYALQVRLSASSNGLMTINGVGVDTEFVRSSRFHK
jgi:hypothetical protein